MSVRATDSLIAEVVIATGLSNSPRMIVQSVNAGEKLITTVWFSDAHEAQQGIFPAGSLDKAENVEKSSKRNKAVVTPGTRNSRRK